MRLLSKKEQALSRLSDARLLELARSVSGKTVDSATSRNDLIEIVKSSLSIEEIKQKLDGIGIPTGTGAMRTKALVIGAVGQVFLIIYSIAIFIVSDTSGIVINTSPSSVASIDTDAILGLAALAFFLIFNVLNLWAMVSSRETFFSNRAGIISGLIGLIASIVGISYYVATILGLTYGVTYPAPNSPEVTYNSLGTLLPYVYMLSLDLTFVSIGVFFLLHRNRFPDGDISLTAGITYLFASTTSNYMLVSYGFAIVYLFNPILLVAAGALGLACFSSQVSKKS